MSYGMICESIAQSDVHAVGAPGLVLAPGPDIGLLVVKMWMRPVPEGPPPYSDSSTPMRTSRHSSVSAAPVEIAMAGMSPTAWLLGSASLVLSRADASLSVHLLTLGIV